MLSRVPEAVGKRGCCPGRSGACAYGRSPDARWFATFMRELQAGDAAGSERLKMLQGKLANLVRLLDDEGRYTDASSQPDWMRRT